MLRANLRKGANRRDAIAGTHRGEWGGPRNIAEAMTPRDSEILEINIPKTEEEANPGITFAPPAHNNISCCRDSWGVLHIITVSIPEPNDLVGLRPDSRAIRISPETWSQGSAEDLYWQ